jgi:hypothetical protein
MPANLNALIRYKTINGCLFGGKRRWSIRELIEACSEALGESRGRYSPISERTVRDDLRVMKSDMLGFNAPIEQEKGLYFYSDPQYSILTLKITDAELADRILDFLVGLRTEIQHPELESILKLLSSLTGRKYEKPPVKEVIKAEERPEPGQQRPYDVEYLKKLLLNVDIQRLKEEPDVLSRSEIRQVLPKLKEPSSDSFKAPIQKKIELSWGDVFEKIMA